MKRLLTIIVLAGPACDRKKEIQDQGQKVVDQNKDRGRKILDMAQTAIEVKRELDKVYKTETDYDLAVSSEEGDSATMKEHEAKIQAMPHVTIEGVTVGYVESEERSIRGVSYTKHYRATWCRNGRKIGVGYYSKKEIDAIAFVELLKKLVPIVERQLAKS